MIFFPKLVFTKKNNWFIYKKNIKYKSKNN